VVIAHETQHVKDIEDVGSGFFYETYAVAYLQQRLRGKAKDEAYRNIFWERRAYDLQSDYPRRQPQGIFDEFLGRVMP
jgi:hypothetical protein